MFDAGIQYLKTLKKRFNGVELLHELLQESKVQEVLIDLNLAQLYEGERSDGSKLGKYSPFTIKIKVEEGKFIDDNIRLNDEGDFYNSWRVVVRKKYYEFRADIVKEDTNLEKRYGEDIFGLQDISQEKFVEFIIPLIIAKLKVLPKIR